MKIGITEWGDAGIDLRWTEKVDKVDGMILITKNLNPVFQTKVLEYHRSGVPIIIHCTCTGWGHTSFEPCVPDYRKQLNWLKDLIDNGFPAEQIVLRIDPIFPSEAGLNRILEMLAYFQSLKLPENKIRYRMSVVDEYAHVKARYKEQGFIPLYGTELYANESQMALVGDTLSKLPYTFGTCAEDKLATKYPDTFKIKGCISKEDLEILGLQYDPTLFENPQNRSMCHCLSCKTEILTPRKACPHRCIYCFWKD
jgi:hypothetical protein